MNRESFWGFLAIAFAVWGVGYMGYHVAAIALSARRW